LLFFKSQVVNFKAISFSASTFSYISFALRYFNISA